MKLKPLNINGISAKLPIVQGGMGVGVSLSRLAGAVATEGGVGVISAAHPGYNLPEFATNPLKANLDALAHHIRVAKEKARGGLIGVNIMCAMRDYVEYVKCSIANKADLIISGAGLPSALPELVCDSEVRIAPIVSSAKAATVLLKLWDRKYSKTADMVVIEGPKAGGHLGFSAEELAQDVNFDAAVTDILAVVAEYEGKYKREIPVVFGGGVQTKADVQHYMNLGCAGVQISTPFVATEECDAHENFKLAYVNACKEDVVIVKSPVGMPGRALNNKFIRDVSARGLIAIDKCNACITSCNPKSTPYCITQALINSVYGDVDNGLIFCGDEVDKIDRISTVRDVMGKLVGD